MSADGKAVCIPCRKVYKGNNPRRNIRMTTPQDVLWFKAWMGNGKGMHGLPEKCPECHRTMFVVPWTWRPPKRNDDRGWKRMEKRDSPHGWWRSDYEFKNTKLEKAEGLARIRGVDYVREG